MEGVGMLELKSESELSEHLRGYTAIVHVSGFGCKQQYIDVEKVAQAVAVPLFEGPGCMDELFGKGRWGCCFGGDPVNWDEPDVAVLIAMLQRNYGMKVIAIQADKVKHEWGGVDKHIDVVYYYPTEYGEDGVTVAWGGLKGGRPVGTTRILLDVLPVGGPPLHWVAAGGGDISFAECREAFEQGIATLCIKAEARMPQDADLPFGPCLPYWESMTSFDVLGQGEYSFRKSRQRRAAPRPRRHISGNPVLITGATGLLGRQVLREFEQRGWDVHGCGLCRATGRIRRCNLTNTTELQALLETLKPSIVIHCAAERRPDVLEKNKEKATKINVDVTSELGKLCKSMNIWMIYLSTNYVFDGEQSPYAEDAASNPINTYGMSKLEGEVALRTIHKEAAILRVPLLYGPIEYLGETSVTALLNAIQKDGVSLDNWQERFPTCTSDLAEVLELFAASYLRRRKEAPDLFSGVFHWQANQMHTKYTMAVAIADIAGFDCNGFVHIDDAPKAGQAPRPHYEAMTCQRIEDIMREAGENPDSFRSDFKAALSSHLRPFVPYTRDPSVTGLF